MPGILPASEHLLDAIFAHTNKLHWRDRQVILRFLGGEDATALALRSNSSFVNLATPLSSSATPSQPQTSGHQALNTSQASRNIIADSGSLIVNETTGLGVLSRRAAALGDGNLRQILLHEERKTEWRPRSSAVRSRTPNGNNEAQDVPMKLYTIVDQIIFEANYATGCWRKLRRRIKIGEKTHTSSSS